MKQAAAIMAAFVYNTANRDEKLPRKPAPGGRARPPRRPRPRPDPDRRRRRGLGRVRRRRLMADGSMVRWPSDYRLSGHTRAAFRAVSPRPR